MNTGIWRSARRGGSLYVDGVLLGVGGDACGWHTLGGACGLFGRTGESNVGCEVSCLAWVRWRGV